MPLIKLIGVANRQSPVIARKYLPLCHRNTSLSCVLTNALIKHYRLHSTDPDFRLHLPLARWWWCQQLLQNLVWSQKQVLRSAHAITCDGQLWRLLQLQSIIEDIKPDYRDQGVFEGFCCCCLFVWGGGRGGVFPWLGKILPSVIAK